jgi:zinc/manganese transport system permease protein
VLGLVFLILVGVTAGVATQAVGALLLLALLAGPAAAAQRLTARPSVALVIAASIAVAAVWIGLTVSYRFDRIPPSVAITAGVTVGYVLAVLWSRTRSTAHASAGRGIMPVGDHARDASGLVPRSVRGASAPLLGWKRLD